jgi:hypothetical protein
MAPRRIRRVKVGSKMRGHLRRLAIRSGHGFIPDTSRLVRRTVCPCLKLDIDPIELFSSLDSRSAEAKIDNGQITLLTPST